MSKILSIQSPILCALFMYNFLVTFDFHFFFNKLLLILRWGRHAKVYSIYLPRGKHVNICCLRSPLTTLRRSNVNLTSAVFDYHITQHFIFFRNDSPPTLIIYIYKRKIVNKQYKLNPWIFYFYFNSYYVGFKVYNVSCSVSVNRCINILLLCY